MKKKHIYILAGGGLLGIGAYLYGKGTLTKKLQDAVNAGDIETAKQIVAKTQKKPVFKEIVDTSMSIPENYKIVELNGEQVAVPVADEDYWQENIEGNIEPYQPTVWSAVKETISNIFGKISGR